MRNIKALGTVALILLIALVMLVTPLTATVVLNTPKYGPTCEDLSTYTEYTYVEYDRYTKDELTEISEEWGQICVYGEYGIILEEKPQPNEPVPMQGVHIYEFTNDNAAKMVYETFYKEHSISDYDPIGIDIGDEGISCYQEKILFRTGRFLVDVHMDYFGEDIARITDQNIKIATAPPSVRSTPMPTTPPNIGLVVEGVRPGIDVNVKIFHHGGDTITGAFKSAAVTDDLGNKWANFEMRLNGAKVNKDEASGLWMNDIPYTDTWKPYFEPGDQLTITFDELKPDDSLVVLHTPTDSILQRVTVIEAGISEKLEPREIEHEPTPAPTAVPTATPEELLTPIMSPFASLPPQHILGAAVVIAISLMIAGIGISRKRKKGESRKTKHPAETQKPTKKEKTPPTSKPILIERAIYDPCKRDFVERALPRMKEWINRYDPGAYWFAISIQNNTAKPIEEWGVELETSSALKIKEAKIEGIEIEIPHEAHLGLFKISVPKEYGIVIPEGGAQRVYFKLRAAKPKTTYEISGIFKNEFTGDVPIRTKEFKYLCDTGVSPEAVNAELKKTFSEKDAARLANTFRVVQELRSSYCSTDTTAREINKEFDLLKMYFTEKDFLAEIENIQRRLNAELREDERLDDKHVEAVKEFCEKFTEMWIARFLR